MKMNLYCGVNKYQVKLNEDNSMLDFPRASGIERARHRVNRRLTPLDFFVFDSDQILGIV